MENMTFTVSEFQEAEIEVEKQSDITNEPPDFLPEGTKNRSKELVFNLLTLATVIAAAIWIFICLKSGC